MNELKLLTEDTCNDFITCGRHENEMNDIQSFEI